MKNTKTMFVANDLGYGSVKATVDGEKIKFPSVMVVQRQQDLFDPITFDDESEKEQYISHMIDHMDISVQSTAVKMQGRFLVGQSAVDSNLNTKSFDVNDMSGKSETDLSLIFTLGMIAAQRVKKAYKNGEDLGKQLETEVYMATALPILEGKRSNAREKYEERFTKTSHAVTIHNFADPITVKISFKEVYVAFEGETAQYALMNADDKLKETLKEDFDENYPEFAGEVTADDLTQLQNALGIDIGEGTTDFVVFLNDEVNATSSTSLAMGYGNVLEEAVASLAADGMFVSSRTDLQKLISEPASLFAKAKKAKAQAAVDEQLNMFSDEIAETASRTLRKVANGIEIVFVYGGGATPMASSVLRSAIQEKLHAYNRESTTPIVWVDKKYSQLLNMMGLELIIETMKETMEEE